MADKRLGDDVRGRKGYPDSRVTKAYHPLRRHNGHTMNVRSWSELTSCVVKDTDQDLSTESSFQSLESEHFRHRHNLFRPVARRLLKSRGDFLGIPFHEDGPIVGAVSALGRCHESRI